MGELSRRARLFRTDGVRGVAGRDVTAALALDLGVAAAAVLCGSGHGGPGTPVAVVGRDPRVSGDFLEALPRHTPAGIFRAGFYDPVNLCSLCYTAKILRGNESLRQKLLLVWLVTSESINIRI